MQNIQNSRLSRRAFVTGAVGLGAVAAISAVSARTSLADEEPAEETPAEAGDAATGTSYDVIIVGAGGAGMTAAMSAHDGGAKVLLLEKMAVAGGNTVCAEGGMNACCT